MNATLAALAWLTRHHGRPRSAESLQAGLPMSDPPLPAEVLRVMREAGYDASWVERDLARIHPLLLPVVLMLEGGEACVLLRIHDGGCDIVMPAVGDAVRTVPTAELASRHLGFALLVHPRGAARADADEPAGHWLWGTLRRFVPHYRAALLAALLTNVLMLVTGIVTSVVFDKVIPHQAFVTLWALAAGGALALAFDVVARQMRSRLIDAAGRRADLLIGASLLQQTLQVRLDHRPASAGVYAHHLAQVEVVRDFFASASLAALSDLPFIVMFVAMTFVVGGPLGWVLVIALPLIVALAAVIQGSLRRSTRTHLAQQADLQGVLVEAVEGLEDIKSAGAQGRFVQRFEAASAAAAEAALRSRMLSSWAQNLSSVAQQAITLVMLVWGVYLIHDGAISGGALIGSVMFAGRAVAPLASVVGLATRFQGARAAMAVLDRLMREPRERDPDRAYLALPQPSGALALKDARFAYPAGDGGVPVEVLKGVDLPIRAGERIAVLGRIGSGKSTVLRLLAGLYAPSGGRVEVDGIDLRQVDPADFRAAVGFVSQEPRLFNGTLRDNVLLGRHLADAAQLAEVARLTGLDRVVAGHPLGWELPVGEMGALLSGGQRQLVALARCLVTQPRILLMDEPTSSMDAQSEIAFLRQLDRALGNRTVVLVTHRPAVLELVQRIVVVEDGRIVMDGPKAAVLARLAGNRAAPAPAAAGAAAPATTPATTPAPTPTLAAAEPAPSELPT